MTPNVFKWTDFAVAHGIRLGAILLVALILNRLLRILTRRLIPSADSDSPGRVAKMREQHVKTLSGILYSAGTAVILLGAILTALPELGFTITPIAAVAGLASLSIGFGAQNLVRDVISGFFVIIEDQFVVGETVRIVTSVATVTGRVEHITLRRTVVRDGQGAIVTIPNGDVNQVANLSRDWGQVFVDVTLSLQGSSDAAVAVLEQVAAEFRADAAWSPVMVDGPRVLGIETLGPGGTTIRVQLRTVPGRQDDAARELRRRIQNRFEQEHIQWGGVQRIEITGSEIPQGIAARSNS